MKKSDSHFLIVEGGGFKTGFTSGLLDAFIVSHFNPFSDYVAVSGGTVAISYFLADQYRQSLLSLLKLSKDPDFLNYKRTFAKAGYMDIDKLIQVATKKVTFDLEKAYAVSMDKEVSFVLTNRVTGAPCYMRPNRDNWLNVVTASCTLPFVTKGKHIIDGIEYFDGGWSDALPVKWAYDNGAKRITILRTWPSKMLSTQSWADYFASFYFKEIPGLQNAFQSSYEKYNQSIDFINNPPNDVIIDELYPKKMLKSGTYSYSKKTIMNDYRYGLDVGLKYVFKYNSEKKV